MIQKSHQRKGLALLVGVEMWERYSFYGLRAILVLFLTASTARQGLNWSAGDALRLYALYGGASYLLPVVGGWLADRFIGARRAMYFGGWIIALGHLLLAVPLAAPYFARQLYGVSAQQWLSSAEIPLGQLWHLAEFSREVEERLMASPMAGADVETMLTAAQFENTFIGLFILLGLLGIIVGTGLFKATVATMLGALYEPEDPQRESAFALFYVGINLGVFLSLVICGLVGERIGWHFGLMSAGVGFLLGMSVYAALEKRYLPDIGALQQRLEGGKTKVLTALERGRVIAILSLFPFSVVFWMSMEQFAGSLSLFARDFVDRIVMGFEIPVAWFVIFNTATIVLIGPALGALWVALERRGKNPLPMGKFATCLAIMGIAYLLLYFPALRMEGGDGAKMAAIWLIAFYVAAGLAELLLQPVALTTISRFGPRQYESLLFGFWYTSLALGSFFAGSIGALLQDLPPSTLFAFLAWVCGISAVAMLVVRPLLKRRFHPDVRGP